MSEEQERGHEGPVSSRIAGRSQLSTGATLRRGLELSPELRDGLLLTLLLAVVATVGRVVIPFVVQQTTDNGINAEGGPDVGFVVRAIALAGGVVVLTSIAQYAVNVRLFTAAESGLATLRLKAFRHIHDLSVLTQSTERRGGLVSRVTSDVDTISQFVQFGGLMLLVSSVQIVLATILMLFYSPILAGVVYLCLVPLALLVRRFQPVLGRAYGTVRERVGDLLGSIGESIVGATTIRAYGVEERTAARIDEAVEAHRVSAIRAQVRSVMAFVSGQAFAGITMAVVLVVGTVLAANGQLTLGKLLAFPFLVNLFTQPVLMATEILNEMQNAIAGWRRVIGVIDTPADVSDPGPDGVVLDRGPITVDFEDVSYAYPGGARVLEDVDLHIAPHTRVAVVGQTGSGKTTLAKLLTRLMDPLEGVVRLDGVDLREVSFASLRQRVVLVPQEGFLFDADLADNIRVGRPEASDDDLRLAVTELGLDAWVDSLPHGLGTQVGQRGESLSAGERQLVAIARAYLADPDLLVLDEATSAVDPATEVRVQRALEGLTTGRTSVAIAHRLSTAEAADVVVVVDAGRIVELGHHRDLVDAGGVYTRMHASWAAQQAV
ncbi:ABC-type multidrug transport system ATPase and permease components [Serinicoccus hydrothermalis]|uniref:ABC-type multidrug transport system ATPase and permease components n=1 Tax=Serinicoccus hydrothermalis TaxID=1758689 RepID=A0A1B1N866_9MICO|nr:ABC transporter ATP-binding protein [Serinicoccus hydrothermalis]ANS77611.1 ABC-type multidrug transport system ATPase and permease components [Serinicoccus hydrothermalis]